MKSMKVAASRSTARTMPAFVVVVCLLIVSTIMLGYAPAKFSGRLMNDRPPQRYDRKEIRDHPESHGTATQAIDAVGASEQSLPLDPEVSNNESNTNLVAENIKVSERHKNDYRASEPECIYGAAIAVARRERDGVEYQYWQSAVEEIFKEINVVVLINRLNRPINDSRFTRIIVPEDDQPEFDENVLMRKLKGRHGDSEKRVRWRSSLSLDLVRAVRFISDRCKYALWFEDDAAFPSNWQERVRQLTPKGDDWVFRGISQFTQGVLFNSKHAHNLLQYITHHFDEDPVDWTLLQYNDYLRRYKPHLKVYQNVHLIGHRGKFSSLTENEVRKQVSN